MRRFSDPLLHAPVALGCKYWLDVGSAKAGPKVAAILRVMESCSRPGVPLKEYLLDVLPGLDYRKLSEVARLLDEQNIFPPAEPTFVLTASQASKNVAGFCPMALMKKGDSTVRKRFKSIRAS
jgi:hypothetical protein